MGEKVIVGRNELVKNILSTCFILGRPGFSTPLYKKNKTENWLMKLIPKKFRYVGIYIYWEPGNIVRLVGKGEEFNNVIEILKDNKFRVNINDTDKNISKEL